MRIVKKGKKAQNTFELTCRHCETVFEVNRDELTYGRHDPKDNHAYTFFTCNCPNCGYEVHINSDEVNKLV